jgi:hypothetical protein
MRTKYTEEFELFWALYPPRWNEDLHTWRKNGKQAAFVLWEKMTVEDKIKAFETAKKLKGSKWTPDARKWLLNKMWEDLEMTDQQYRDSIKERKGQAQKLGDILKGLKHG